MVAGHLKFLLLFIGIFSLCCCDEYSTFYRKGEAVIVWANKVGPYHNPQETYPYFALPFCKPSKSKTLSSGESPGGLVEIFEDNELVNTGIDISFLEYVDNSILCSVELLEDPFFEFQFAVSNDYWYQFYVDNLPTWSMVGEELNEDGDDEASLIYTHKRFSIGYNGNQIIDVNLTSENLEVLSPGKKLEFTYSVTWTAVQTPFAQRFLRYLDHNFFEHKVHWFSVVNAFLITLALSALVAIILGSTLKKDFARYAEIDHDQETLFIDESGWRQVQGEVTRSPPALFLFCALVGTGAHLAALSLVLIMSSLGLSVYTGPASFTRAMQFSYVATTPVSGYVSSRFFQRCQVKEGEAWVRNTLCTLALFPSFCFSLIILLNVISYTCGSFTVVTHSTLAVLLLLWAACITPLTFLGSILGRRHSRKPDYHYACWVSPMPRAIPPKPWHSHPLLIVFGGGILPFGSIFVEMYFVFSAFWSYKYYYMFGLMLAVFVMLVIVTLSSSIVGTYCLLSSEDYRYQWMSFFSGASTGLYSFLYAIFYFIKKTRMRGVFQTAYYFGYSAMFCCSLSLMCGSISFLGSLLFVRSIYRNIKSD